MRFALILITFLLVTLWPGHAHAERYASVVVDADTLDIIHARQIDEPRFPASLTKVMTLYLTFDALNAGELTLKDRLPVSATAAVTPPVGLGLRKGQTITVEQAIQALTVRSANDAAVVLAERLAGSETAFAQKMTAKARDLKMQRTRFMTASGLPHPDQTTTARDMAKLAMAVLRDHKRYYHYFGQKTFTYKGRTYKNTNGLLHSLPGIDGFKTGYTHASGYNLIISAERSERRIIAVVLGGASGPSRNRHMTDLINRSFKVIGAAPAPQRAPVTVKRETVPEPAAATLAAVRLRGQDNQTVVYNPTGAHVTLPSLEADRKWVVRIGAFKDENSAQAFIAAITARNIEDLPAAKASLVPSGPNVIHIHYTNLPARQARTGCATLKAHGGQCMVIAPGA